MSLCTVELAVEANYTLPPPPHPKYTLRRPYLRKFSELYYVPIRWKGCRNKRLLPKLGRSPFL